MRAPLFGCLALATAGLGCAHAGMLAAPPDDQQLSIGSVGKDLESLGYDCRPDVSSPTRMLTCTHQTFLNLTFQITDEPPRLVHWAVFTFKKPGACKEMAPKVQSFNEKYNLFIVSCVPGSGTNPDSLVFQTAILLPAAGFSRHELLGYFKWLTEQPAAEAHDLGVFDALQ